MQNNFDDFTKNIAMKHNNMIFGAIILMAGGLIAKVFSAIYRIALTRILGGAGIGIYQLIFPIYSLFVVLSTAGLPLAVSKIVAKNIANKKVVLKKCMRYILIISFVLTAILIVFSRPFAKLQQVEEIYICYLILAPSIILIGASSVYKGYFQGVKDFKPSAICNVVEQFFKLLLGLVLSLSLIRYGIIYAVIGAVISIFISEILSYFYLLYYYKKQKIEIVDNNFNLSFKEIFKDVFPITLTNLILPFSGFIDSVLVVNLLKLNFTTDVSVYLYGLESGAVSSLINIPTIFSFALATVLMPSICDKISKVNKCNCLNLSLKLSLLAVIPSVLCFIFFPRQLLTVLYGNKISDFGLNGTQIASKLMIISSFGIVALVINQVLSSSLQANNFKRTTVINFAIAIGVKLLLELILMPIATVNIYALAIANSVCYICVAILNFNKLKNFLVVKFDFVYIGKILISSVVMIMTMLIVLNLGNNLLNIVFAFVLGGATYLFSITKLDVLNREEKAVLKYRL